MLSTCRTNFSAIIATPRLVLGRRFPESMCAGFVSSLPIEKLGQVVGEFFSFLACCDVTAHSTERNV